MFVTSSLGFGLANTLTSGWDAEEAHRRIEANVKDVKEHVAQSKWSDILLHMFWYLWKKGKPVPHLFALREALKELDTAGSLPLDALVVGCMNEGYNGVLQLLETVTDPGEANMWRSTKR